MAVLFCFVNPPQWGINQLDSGNVYVGALPLVTHRSWLLTAGAAGWPLPNLVLPLHSRGRGKITLKYLLSAPTIYDGFRIQFQKG